MQRHWPPARGHKQLTPPLLIRRLVIVRLVRRILPFIRHPGADSATLGLKLGFAGEFEEGHGDAHEPETAGPEECLGGCAVFGATDAG